MSQPIGSTRYLVFAGCVVLFWMAVPLLILTQFTGPLGQGILIYLVFMYFALPYINTWLVSHTRFGKLWAWARANEVKLRAEDQAAKAKEATGADISHESAL